MDIKIKKCDCCGIEARSDMSEDKELFEGFANLDVGFNCSYDLHNKKYIRENGKYILSTKALSLCEACIYDLGLSEPVIEEPESDIDNTSGFLKCLSNLLKGK